MALLLEGSARPEVVLVDDGARNNDLQILPLPPDWYNKEQPDQSFDLSE